MKGCLCRPLVVTEEIVVLKGASTLASHSKPRSYNHILHRRWFLQNINYILWCCKTWGVTNQWVGLQRLHPSFIYSVWHAHFALYSVWLWKRNRDWQSVNSKPKQWFYLSFVYIHQIVSLFMICLIKINKKKRNTLNILMWISILYCYLFFKHCMQTLSNIFSLIQSTRTILAVTLHPPFWHASCCTELQLKWDTILANITPQMNQNYLHQQQYGYLIEHFSLLDSVEHFSLHAVLKLPPP